MAAFLNPKSMPITEVIAGLAGPVMESATQLTMALNPKVRDHNLAMAEAQRDTAIANAQVSKNNSSIDPKVWIAVAFILVIILLLIFKRH